MITDYWPLFINKLINSWISSRIHQSTIAWAQKNEKSHPVLEDAKEVSKDVQEARGTDTPLAWLCAAQHGWFQLVVVDDVDRNQLMMLVILDHSWAYLSIVDHFCCWSQLMLLVIIQRRCAVAVFTHSSAGWLQRWRCKRQNKTWIMNFQSAWLTQPLAATLSINLWSLRAVQALQHFNHLEPWPLIRWLTLSLKWWPLASTCVSSTKIAWFQQWDRYITWPLRTWFSTPSFFSALVTNRCRGRLNNNQSTTENNECQPCWTCCRWMFDHQVVV